MPDAGGVRLSARAKANLRLRVLAREASGYHGVETLLIRLELADEVEIEAGEEGIELVLEGPDGEAAAAGAAGEVPDGPENLAWRAAEAFLEATGRRPAVRITLRKRIPAGAGLGGGSADAAAVLRGLSELHGEPLEEAALLELAGRLGSDVPFALSDLPAALAWGRGGRLLPVPPPPTRPMALVVPDTRVATADAYRWLDEDRVEATGEGGADDEGKAGAAGASGAGNGAAGLLPDPDLLAYWDVLEELALNDFEKPVVARIPELGWWKEELAGEGASLALLCGSGCALLGVFEGEERRDAAADRIEASGTASVLRTRGPV